MMRRPYHVSRRGARRLLDGDPATRAQDARLGALLDALTRDAPDRGEHAVPAEVLAAFARQAAETGSRATRRPARIASEAAPQEERSRRTGARGARSRRLGRALAVKTVAVVLVLSGGTMAAAAANALPGPAQRAAHRLFGSWGVPAPSAPRHGPERVPHTGPALPVVSASADATGKGPDAKPGARGGASPSAGAGDCSGHTRGGGNGNGNRNGDSSGHKCGGTPAPGKTQGTGIQGTGTEGAGTQGTGKAGGGGKKNSDAASSARATGHLPQGRARGEDAFAG